MPGQVEQMPELSVVEMTEKRLTIDIKPAKGKKWKLPDKTDEDEEEEYEPPSSADIQVIHKHPPPDLHSILKQRSVSESSEEVSNGDPDSPRSEGEELSSSFSKKRSVSFSNHVDHASFKSTASVSSMTPALKSKRRRQRRRDEKKNGRVRCNSGGTSSSEECMHSMSDSYFQSEEELESASKKSKGSRKAVLFRAVSDPGPNIEGLSGEEGSGEPGKQAQRKNKGSDCQMLVPKSNDVFDFDSSKVDSFENGNVNGSKVINDSNSKDAGNVVMEEGDVVKQLNVSRENLGNEEMGVNSKNKKIISEIKDRLAEENGTAKNGQKEDSDDDDFVDAVSSLVEEFKTKVECSESVNGTDDVNEDSCSKPYSEAMTSLIEEMEPSIANESVRENESGHHRDRSDASDKGCNKHVKSNVETVLSWEEGGVTREHETTCAFQFSNSLMFDLDVE